MSQYLDKLLQDYSNQTGYEYKVDSVNKLTLTVEGLDIHFVVIENTDDVIIQTAVDDVPQNLTDAQKANYYLNLLASNNLFLKTKGNTFGVDKTSGIITVQVQKDINQLTLEELNKIVDNLISAVIDWVVLPDDKKTEDISASDDKAQTDNQDQNFSDFMRV